MSFETLDKDTLFRTAVEDFGVEVKPTDSKKIILAALLEDGITWDLYLQAHPEARPVEEAVVAPVVAPVPENVITSESLTGKVEVVTPEPVVRTRAEPVNAFSHDLYLIKMDRDNPYFEFRKYKFTQAHPYVVMPAADADVILKTEEGFSIATPSEAAEYYG